ncbi:ParA family protein [Novosphingobium clariflavum]|uniref:ParA family protein n=1 Tax=Novosphingobium clariflavum TaxID=2029884 RepID=A0ABV6SDZ7_9SPHN|nr:ParA family protein [Novosphingobium clariflavum]
MAVIAVYSIKGGVGKTTLAVDLAWRFAVHGARETLLWDLDMQGGAGWVLGHEPAKVAHLPAGAAAVFQRDGKPQHLVRPTHVDRLSLICADDSLRSLPLQLARLGQRRRLAAMTTRLRCEYERIVLDCPAGMNEVTEQVIAAADLVIVPLPPSPLARRALDMVRRELLRHHTRHAPILPVLSMTDMRRRLHRDLACGEALGWPQVPMASAIERCSVHRRPLAEFAGGTPADLALGRLWRGIEAKLAAMAPVLGGQPLSRAG